MSPSLTTHYTPHRLIVPVVKATGRFNYTKTGGKGTRGGASRFQLLELPHPGGRKGRDMHHDPLLGRFNLEKPLFRCRLVASSHGARPFFLFLFFFDPPLGCSNRRLQVKVICSSTCEYDNGYLVFDRISGAKEVWRLASDFSAEGEVAAHSPPDSDQMFLSARAAEVYQPHGHFRPWALLRSDEFKGRVCRLAYPTLISANYRYDSLHDVRTGSLVQTFDVRIRYCHSVDVNERHAFVCERDVVHVFSRESGSEVLRIPTDAAVRYCQLVEVDYHTSLSLPE